MKRCIVLMALAFAWPVEGQTPEPRPQVAVWVSGYGPILPSEWRERVLPAARRSLARLHPDWTMLSAPEVARLEAEANERAASDPAATLNQVLTERYPGAHTFALDASCGDDECLVRGAANELGDGAVWTFPRTLSVQAWTRALAEVPADERMGIGRGFGGRGLRVREALGAWTDESREQASDAIAALPWPEACVPERVTVMDLVVDVQTDGSLGEIGASGGSRALRRCLEGALPGALEAGSIERARGARRLLLLGIGRPPG